jgi:membrane protein
MVVYIPLQALIGREVGAIGGGHVLVYVIGFMLAVVFFWWTPYVLLQGRIAWGPLFPTGLATGICVTGLSVFAALLASKAIVSNHQSYGPIGVVTVLLSYMIGLAVCLHLGAVLGRMWSERYISTDASRSRECPAVTPLRSDALGGR